jgi:signal transduction histidine kinase
MYDNAAKHRVLVVEDDVPSAVALGSFLTKVGCEVLTVHDGPDAVQVALERMPELVFTDVGLPTMDGYGVLDELRAKAPDIPVIVMTGMGDIASAVRAMRAGAENYLEKPLDFDAVTVAIDTALERRRLRAEKERAEAETQALVAQLRERGRQLEEANKELDAFSYSVSHDLRAPLRAIDGFARILLEDHALKLDKDGQRAARAICDDTQKMGQLIDDLLRLSRQGRQAVRSLSVNMTALAHEAADEACRSEAARTIYIRIGELPTAVGDPDLLRQVWLNLVGNAVKYTRPRATAVVEVTGTSNEAEVVYAVRDNGVGFDPRYAAKLFGVFQRLHPASEFEGTGVGLALVQRIVRRHGGCVNAWSVLGEGATFSFALPVASAGPATR